jgi:hypothetical protein
VWIARQVSEPLLVIKLLIVCFSSYLGEKCIDAICQYGWTGGRTDMQCVLRHITCYDDMEQLTNIPAKLLLTGCSMSPIQK